MKEALIRLLLKAQTIYYASATSLGQNKVTVNQNVNAEDAVGGFLDIILWGTTILGGAMFIWGGVDFSQSLSDTGGDKKQQAIIKIVGGAVMISIRFILQNMGVIS